MKHIQPVECGFYWVKPRAYDKWTIGEKYKTRDSTYWRLLGDDLMWGDLDLYEIGEKIENKNDL